MITQEEARHDLRTYNSLMQNTELNIEGLICIEEKYGVYGFPPQLVAAEIGSYITNKGERK